MESRHTLRALDWMRTYSRAAVSRFVRSIRWVSIRMLGPPRESEVAEAACAPLIVQAAVRARTARDWMMGNFTWRLLWLVNSALSVKAGRATGFRTALENSWGAA